MVASCHHLQKRTELKGFAELEYRMLRYMGAIHDSTLIVTPVIFGFCLCNF